MLEKNRKLGAKILISGGTRCNISHHTDIPGIVGAFPKRQGQFLRSALAALPPHQLIELIEQEGVPTQVEENGKIFPTSNRAIDVRDALVRFLRRTDCDVRSETAVVNVIREAEAFRIELSDGTILARSVIIAVGGQSYPGCGTTGDGYSWSEELGHTIVSPVPALTPIHSPDRWVGELSGVTLQDVALAVRNRTTRSGATPHGKKGTMDERRGSLLFAHFGLTGPAALDISRAITRSTTPTGLVLLANFAPNHTYEVWLQRLRQEIDGGGKRQINSTLAEFIPRRLAEAILGICQVDPTRRLAELSKRDQTKLVETMTGCEINISGTAGFKKAEVTAGGVALEEVHSKTMESKRIPRCFFAGEVLDIDGPIGGYNFQAAFSTGWLAGSSV